jgi:hypothetical protein
MSTRNQQRAEAALNAMDRAARRGGHPQGLHGQAAEQDAAAWLQQIAAGTTVTVEAQELERLQALDCQTEEREPPHGD